MKSGYRPNVEELREVIDEIIGLATGEYDIPANDNNIGPSILKIRQSQRLQELVESLPPFAGGP